MCEKQLHSQSTSYFLDISPIIMTQEQDRAVEAIFRIQFGHYFKVSLSVKCYEHQFS